MSDAASSDPDIPWSAWPDVWDGDPEKLFNRDQMARALGISKPTLDTLRQQGMPYRREGKNGQPWGFYLPEVMRWKGGVDKAEADAKAEKERKVAAAQLALIGGEVSGDYAIKPQERKQLYEAELRRMELDRKRGNLIEAAELRLTLRQAFTGLGNLLQALPESLGRDMGWDLGTIALCQESVDREQERLARILLREVEDDHQRGFG